MVKEMLRHDVMMCMLCVKQKRKVMKTSESKKSRLLDNDCKPILQGDHVVR